MTGVDGNISIDPKYVDAAGLNFHLQSTSPGIDSGTSVGAPDEDLDFNLRPNDAATPNTGAGAPNFFDIGAYEFGAKPRAVKSRPVGNVADVVSNVVFTFRGQMDPTSFSSAADVVSFIGPSGAIAVTGFQWLDRYRLQLNFNTQAKVGTYQLVLGPNILDANHLPLDTDGDGTRGESVEDRYAARWAIVPPKIIDQLPIDFMPAPVDHMDLKFDRPMDQQSFVLSDIASFKGPSGDLAATGFTWLAPDTLRILFDSQSALGVYELVLKPSIADIGGNLLDQNGNGLAGEDPGDDYTANFTLANVFHLSGSITQNTSVGGLVLIDDNVTVQAGVTLTIAPGSIVKVRDAVSIIVAAGATLSAHGTVAQPIRFTSIHDDTIGGDSEHDGYRIAAHPGDWDAIRIEGGNASIDHAIFTYGGATPNKIWDGSGGGTIVVQNSSQLTLANSSILDSFFDGVLTNTGSQATITNTVIANADRAINVGGIVTLTNSTLDNNRIGIWGHSGKLVMTNSIVSHSLQQGIYNILGTDTTIKNSDVWSATGQNYLQFPDQTGMNGNISVDPKFVNAPGGNYRLNFGSPAIDSALGASAPVTDQSGAPRYDDPRTANTGTITSNNAFADMGAFEFVEGAASNLDLIVATVTGPATGMEGAKITVNWTTKNAGTEVAKDAWHDAVYLSADNVWSPDDVLLGETLHTGDLGPNQSYAGTADVTIPGVLPGPYYLLVRANSDNAVFEGANLSNNVSAAPSTVSVDVPALAIGGSVTGQLVASNDSQLYKIVVPPGPNIKVTLDGPTGVVNELYASLDEVPTRQLFQSRAILPNKSDQSVTLSGLTGGTYYVLVYGATVPTAATFTLSAAVSTYGLTSVSPSEGGNTGLVTVTFNGANFNATSHPQLLDSAHHLIQPKQVYFQDSSTILATFDLTGRPLGAATAQVVTNNVTTSLATGFSIVAGRDGQLDVNLSVPDAVRVGRTFTFTVAYTNSGNTDLLAQIFEVSTNGMDLIGFTPDGEFGTSLNVIAVSPTGPAGILAPGAHGQIVLYGKSVQGGTDSIQVDIAEYPAAPIDWAALEPTLRPAGTSDADWNPLFAQLKSQIGTQWTDYVTAISKDVTLLPSGEEGLNYSLEDVFDLEVDRARAALNKSVSGRLYLGDLTHALSNAELILSDLTQNVAFDTISLTDGSFLFPVVPPGTYQLEIEGFEEAGPITITVGASSATAGNIIVSRGASFSGTAVNATSGAPVTGKLVKAYSSTGELFTAVTDENGAYELDGLPEGTYRVSVGGGDVTTTAVQVELADQEQLRRFNLSVLPAGRISGKVVDGNGAPLAGVVVAAGSAASGRGAAITGADGTFVIDGLAPATYTLTTLLDGFAPARLNGVVVNADSVASNANLSLVTAGSLQGTVTSATDGSAIGSAVITLDVNDATEAVGQADGAGVYHIPNLAPGTYTATVVGAGFQTFTTTVTIAAGQTKTFSPVLTPGGVVKGTVLDGAGHPVENLQVAVTAPDGTVSFSDTDENGAYQFPGLAFGSYTVSIGSDPVNPLVSLQRTVSAGAIQATANFTLATAGSITGRVFASDGVTPLAGVNLELFLGDQAVLDTTTDFQGGYTFLVLQAGTYQIAVRDLNSAFPIKSAMAIAGGTVMSNINFTAGQGTVSGSFRDSVTNQPIQGANVRVSQLLPGGVTNSLIPMTTGFDGLFQIAGLAPGDYRLVLEDGIHATVVSNFTVSTGVPIAPQNLTSGPGNVLTGRLTATSSGQPLNLGQVFVYRHSDHLFIATAAADNQGHYVLPGLPDGIYDIVFDPPGFRQSLVQNVAISGGSQTLDASLPASTTSISGTLVSNGQPVAGARVTATDPTGMLHQTVTADATGHFAMDTLPAGQYTLTGQSPGQSTQSTPVTVAEGQQLPNQTIIMAPVGIATIDSPILGDTTPPPIPQPFPAPVNPIAQDLALINTVIPAPRVGCENEYDNAVYMLDNYQAAVHNFEDAQLAVNPTVLGIPAGVGENVLNATVVLGDVASLFNAVLAAAKALKAANQAIEVFNLSTALDRSTLEVLKDVIDTLGGSQYDTGVLGVANAIRKVFSDAKGFAETFTKQIPKLAGQILRGQPVDPSDMLAATTSLNSLLGFVGKIALVTGKLKVLAVNAPIVSDMLAPIFAPFKLVLDWQKAMTSYEKILNDYTDRKQAASVAFAAIRIARNRFTKALAQLNACNASHADKVGPARPPKPGGGRKHPPVKKPVKNANGGDPNQKVGPAGFGAQGFIQSELMNYEVEFENAVAAGANAPAQVVKVTDTLDADIDPSSVVFTGFGFSNHVFTVPPGLQHYQTTIDLRQFGVDLLVPVELDFNPQTRLVTATFQSLDPLTGLITEDPFAGFLPVNNATHIGEGFFTYTLRPKSGLASGTTITNQASIVFDVNAAILTPTTLNTLDNGGPTSQVTALLATTTTANFTVNWSGTDDTGGSGIASYDVFVKIDGGEYTQWQSATAATSAVYSGETGHTYRFYSVATDNVGHVEAVPLTADAVTTVTLPVSAPPVINDQSFDIAENLALDAPVGTVQATDPDVGDTITYSITEGNTLGAFVLNAQTGAIAVANSALLDFETHPSWPLTIKVTDNHGASDTAVVTIHLTNVNETPQMSAATFSTAENAPVNTVVGTVQASDPDTVGTLTYSITSGNALDAFSINAQTGAISVANASLIDFETHPSYELTVQVADNGSPSLSNSAQITINVTNLNEGPVIPAAQTFTISGAALSGAIIGTVVVTDPDTTGPNSTKNVSILNGSDAFVINAQTGQISVGNAVTLATLAGQVVTLQVTDTDGGTPALSVTQSVSISVTAVNTAPVLATPGPVSTFFGNKKTPVKVAPTLSVTDPDGPTALSSIVISLPLGAAKKNPDIVALPGLSSVGTRADAIVSGRLQITITLKPDATNAAVQTMLDLMTFLTKGKGLKVTSRSFQIQVIDNGGLQSNIITQNVQVQKKAPKPPKPPRS